MISLPKNFRVDPSQLAERLMDFAVTLENQINGNSQIHVLDRNQKLPRNMRRKDIVLRVKQREGSDALHVYWYNGKRLVPLSFSTIDGQISVGQIADFNFLALDDTPDSYAGQGTKVVRVNELENGLEFVTAPAGTGGGGTTSTGCCEILVADGVSAPPVMLTNEAEDDFLYSD